MATISAAMIALHAIPDSNLRPVKILGSAKGWQQKIIFPY